MEFFTNYNNGIKAVVSAEHAELSATIVGAGGDPIKAGVRIFTFCSAERLEDNPELRFIVTGSYEDLDRLVKAGGHTLSEKHPSGWDGYVPFSNGMEFGLHGDEAQTEELRYRTTLRDVMDAFGTAALS